MDDLEAAIWRLLHTHQVTVANAPALVHALLAVFEQHAAGDIPRAQAARRAVLERETER